MNYLLEVVSSTRFCIPTPLKLVLHPTTSIRFALISLLLLVNIPTTLSIPENFWFGSLVLVWHVTGVFLCWGGGVYSLISGETIDRRHI